MLRATIIKDIQLLLHDRGRLLMLFAMPLIFIVVFGSMFKFGPKAGNPRAVAIWYAEHDARGEAIEKALANTPGFTPEHVASAEAVRQAVAGEQVVAGLVIPPDFAPGTKPVELSIDLGGPIQIRGPVQGALTGVVMRSLSPMPAGQMPAVIEAVSPPGVAKPIEDISGFQITVPGNSVLFGFFIAMAVAMSFASERHSGAWRRLLAAPIPRWKAVLGKLVPYYLIGLVQLAVLFGLGVTVFGMRIAGSPLALVLLSALVVLCGVSFGMLVSSFGWTEKQIGSTVPVMLLVMALLGGCMFPRLAMPDFMKRLGEIVPHAWALDGYYAVLVRQGTTVADIAPQLGALAGFSALFAGVGLLRFRFE